MRNRRQFLKRAMGLAAAGMAAHGGSLALADGPVVAPRGGALARPEELLSIEKLKPRGEFHDAVVPDTLDLAERARLAVLNLTHNVDPANHYFNWQLINFSPTVTGSRYTFTNSVITAKNARALPWLRTMSGSEESLDHAAGAEQSSARTTQFCASL